MRKTTAAWGSALFFALGPGIMVGLIPWLLTHWQVREPIPYWAPVRVLGLLLLVAGLAVLVHAFVGFVVQGLGTPAPFAAPSHLVVEGPHRYVRNPMYVALLSIVLGQAFVLGQLILLAYAAIATLPVALYVHFVEEPGLARRFGAEYEEYRRAVPAWWPRMRAWHPDN